MIYDDENRKLDEQISSALGGNECRFDFEQWKRDHAGAVAEYKSQTAGGRFKLLKYAGVVISGAAVIFLAVMLGNFGEQEVKSREIARDESLTIEEIKVKMEIEGIAARVLAKANMIKRNPERVPNAEEFVQNEYRHIVNMYSGTAAAEKAAKLIN